MTHSPGGSVPPVPPAPPAPTVPPVQPVETRNSQSTPEAVRDEAADVARSAARSGADVLSTVAGQAKQVTGETTRQARNLMEEGRGRLADQARQGQRKAADGLHALADQLEEMSHKADGDGVASDVVRQAAERTRGAASWLERHEPGDLLTEVRAFARRRPGVFLAGAAVAGVLAGRLTRGAVSAKDDEETGAPEPGTATPATGNAAFAGGPVGQPPAAPPLPATTPPPVGPVTP